jgi:DNA-directed RNA polymerase subunit RPC12/RpoP
MSNRTFACLTCRKLQRKPQSLARFACPHCGADCLRVHWKLHVPAPKKRRKWDAFWAQYLLELRLLAVFRAGGGPAVLELPLLSQRWVRRER